MSVVQKLVSALMILSPWLLLQGVLAEDGADEGRSLDIRAPGSDLANFPNSAFTLPKGGFYVEMAPASYTGSSSTLSAQYNWEYLLRYGLTDRIELRLYSPGFSVQQSPNAATGFSPLTFDTKIHLWDENQAFWLPAAGLEVLLQTEILGSSAFNAGLEPSFSVNFDQSLPYELQFEYNLGAARFENPSNIAQSIWDFTFSWAIQREIVEDVDFFVNGYTNAANLPRIGRVSDQSSRRCPRSNRVCREQDLIKDITQQGGNNSQHMLGVGGLWTVSDQTSLFANLAGGLNARTPDFFGYVGFAWTP